MTRDALLPILCLLSMAREKGCKVSELLPALPARFTASDRLQSFPTASSRRIIAELAASTVAVDTLLGGLCGKPTAQDQTDGLRLFLGNDEIVHFRPSGNAPELRCYTEAATPERADALLAWGLGAADAVAAFLIACASSSTIRDHSMPAIASMSRTAVA